MNTVIARCVHCHDLILRGRLADPWRVLPGRGERVLPADAAVCARSPDRLHHSPIDEGRTA